ncbi:MAG: CoA transferase [Chloroflexi bacterium]|nr:CoA transferase [Chloroflexota bacterium]
MADSALSGVGVLDLSQGVSGGYCTKLLADLGARVIKVEPPSVGDCTRRAGPFLNDIPDLEASAPFLYLNTGKQSITLDLKSPTGQRILLELVKGTDVLVENFKPGVMEKLGLGYSVLEQVNPGLVMASISCFGQSGPYRDYEGCELVAYAMSGYMYLTGDEDREPLKAGGSQSGYQAGLAAAMAVLAALTRKDFTGTGQYLDVSTIEALAGTFDGVSFYTMMERSGIMPRRAGTRLITREPQAPYPSRLLPCKDGWVHVHWSPSFPEGLALLTGNPGLAAAEVMAAMMGHADEIDQMLVDWLKDHSREEVQSLAQEIRVPFTMVHSIAEVLADPQNEAQGFFVEIDHPVAGRLRYPSPPFRVPLSPWRPARAPLLGEHNLEIYCHRLGHSMEDLTRLRQLNVI